jgi:hypothetical protein
VEVVVDVVVIARVLEVVEEVIMWLVVLVVL